MTARRLVSLGLSSLVLVGGAAAGEGIAGAGVQAPAKGRTNDSGDAGRAGKALAKHDAVGAVRFAEAAVAAAPTRADHRMLLARSYLQAGRFASARDAFADVLRLIPDDGKAALNLVLAQIATGEWQAARATLDAHVASIAPSDRGLALALAGDPATGVRVLTAAARTPGAGPKVRQNLGLALALSGQWPMARAVAAADLSPADVDARVAEWAQFAQPRQPSDQVAALLGVRAIEDRGQPVALALVAPVAAGPAVVVAPVVVASPVAAPMPAAARIVFAPRQAVVQPLLQTDHASMLRSSPNGPKGLPMTVAGGWVVQLGAFADTRGARDAWSRATHRLAGLGDHQPQGTTVRIRGATLHRLSVAGFDRAGADALCGRYRAQGGVCFVRRGAGDRIAGWLRAPAIAEG